MNRRRREWWMDFVMWAFAALVLAGSLLYVLVWMD